MRSRGWTRYGTFIRMSRYRTRSWRAFEPTAARIAAELSVRVLGLDPGSRRTGFGVIDCCRGKLTVVAHGCLNVEFAAAAVDHSEDRKSTRLNSSHTVISYAVFCLKKKKE